MDPQTSLPDWEAFYANYKQPGYVPGFEITSKLGGGMFGLVYKARKQSIGKDYAIKFLKVEDGHVRAAVLAELEQVKYFAQVDHPNLVSIEDRGEVDGIPYLVMAYAGAETLQDRLPAKPEQRDELLRYFLQACRGVAALHERSLVHFDLKPANVFLKGGVARVGDYGLSKLVTQSCGSLTAGRGTPYYMAPELLRRRGDARSDVYSLGVMLYELLCGDVPFRGENEWEVLNQHERTPVTVPVHVGGDERAVIERCLQKDPAQRFQRVEEIVAALGAPVSTAAAAAVIAPVVPLAPPEPPALPTTPPPLPTQLSPLPPPLPASLPPRRRSWQALRAIGVMMMLLIAFGVFVAMRVDGIKQISSIRVGRPGPPSVDMRGRTRPSVARPGPAPQSLASQLHDFGRSVAAAMATAEQRRGAPPKLSSLATATKLQLPPDLANYCEQLAPFADQGEFNAMHAKKLERDGLCMVLAAIETLQGFDYTDDGDCRRAFVLQQFLQQATKFTDFGVVPVRGEPDAASTLRYLLAADGWRRFAENWCKDEATFKLTLQATGKTEGRPN